MLNVMRCTLHLHVFCGTAILLRRIGNAFPPLFSLPEGLPPLTSFWHSFADREGPKLDASWLHLTFKCCRRCPACFLCIFLINCSQTARSLLPPCRACIKSIWFLNIVQKFPPPHKIFDLSDTLLTLGEPSVQFHFDIRSYTIAHMSNQSSRRRIRNILVICRTDWLSIPKRLQCTQDVE